MTLEFPLLLTIHGDWHPPYHLLWCCNCCWPGDGSDRAKAAIALHFLSRLCRSQHQNCSLIWFGVSRLHGCVVYHSQMSVSVFVPDSTLILTQHPRDYYGRLLKFARAAIKTFTPSPVVVWKYIFLCRLKILTTLQGKQDSELSFGWYKYLCHTDYQSVFTLLVTGVPRTI